MTLLEEARALIKAYLSSKPHISVAALAKSAGLPVTTARSIIQGEVQNTAIGNLVALLEVFTEYEEIDNLISKYELDSAEAAYVSLLRNKKAKYVGPESFEYTSPDHEILALASSSFGVSRERIQRAHGDRGSERLEALLNAGMLREINSRIRQPAEHVAYPIVDTQKKVSLQASNWRPKDLDKGGFIWHLTQNYTPEAHEKALEIVKECVEKLTELEKNQSHGDKVVLFSFVCNLLDGEKQ